VYVVGGTRTATVRMATRGTVIHRTVTVIVRIVIRIMGGTIPGPGTATVRMDIPTIGDRVKAIETIPTRPSTECARPLFSHKIAAVLAQ
jgi:hypothetical protein